LKKRYFILLSLFIICLAGGVLAGYFANRQITAEENARLITERLENQLKVFSEEGDQVLQAIKEGESWHHLTSYSFYRIVNDTLVAWNDHHYIPPILSSRDTFFIRFIRTGSGDFLLRKWQFKSKDYLLGAISLSTHYRINNEYLQPRLSQAVFGDQQVTIFEPLSGEGIPVEIDGTTVFRLSTKVGVSRHTGWLYVQHACVVVMLLIIVALVVSFLNQIRERNTGLAFIFLIGCVLLLRLIITYYVGNRLGTDSPLFDPQYFASSDLNPSLGDLLLNVIGVLLLCLFLFNNYHRFTNIHYAIQHPFLQWIVSVSCAVLILFGILFPFVVVQTIYNNSSISFSIVQSIQFDLLRVVAFLAVVLASISTWLFVQVFIRLITIGHNVIRFSLSILIGVVLYILINEYTGQVYFAPLVVALVYLMIVLLFRFHKSISRLQYTTFVYFFTAVVCFASVNFLAIVHFEQKEKTRSQFRFASDFLIERDYFGEYLLSEALQRIKQDGFIQGRMASPLLTKDPVRQKIRQYFLPVYFNKYNVEVLLFNTAGDPIESSEGTKLASLIAKFDREASQTNYPGVYYIAGLQGELTQRYLAVASIHRNDLLVGYTVIQFSLKRIIPENVYPELLVDTRFQNSYRSQQFSYAVYHSGSIQVSAGEFNYDLFDQRYFSDGELYINGIHHHGYKHIAVEDSAGNAAVVSSPEIPWFLRLADFSFLVIIGISIIFLFLFILGAVTFLQSRDLFLAARIQVFLNLAFFLPLIAVSVITLGLTARSSQEQLNDDYLVKSKSFANQLDSYYSKTGNKQLEDNFTELVKLASIDANLFSPKGKLVTTSQPLIFENQLLAPVMDAEALHRVKQGDKNFVSTESVGLLNYYVAYSVLNSSETGELLGIVALPFFQSGVLLEKMQISVLANILMIFTVLFILLLVISFFVSKWLTFPLQMITQTLGKLSLAKLNQPLAWKSDDEIGLMVREYNHMLTKLGESKIELERTQRERAWREIAQQVAHEIKNPLTPMKLTLQQLERSLMKEESKDERIMRSVASLLAQIDTLDGIASSFSAFAKMPEPVMNAVDLLKLVKNLEHFHGESGTVTCITSLSNAWVMADEQLLSRILSNIILNGIQAVPFEKAAIIQVFITEANSYYQIVIRDNGSGIDDSLTEKIFLPHFTTKQSGSGLGLAIARQGVEQMGGKIWFSSSPKGTEFHIELPKLLNNPL
jgi:two-component system, NtrC family, nitrogen regulation sensor histidine kinase NtrY